ncbi:hypothetical protein ACI2S3_06500 [Ralstonia nicotianae]|uniref:Uncharacterized protein n=1 Tax=Ralstonia nicotianae TaxID=3037696 RepID=A0ABX8A1E9_9RALS|nr:MULTISPECIES: hypothetical protein [Ralstonia solanacearum species complex]QKL74566.1 hypothetical protein HI806_25765 [Ralstonia solanacearum]MCK4140603.1 hypothetical protein [Ralstonia pseudosolanacearum]MCK4147269.1 hypothetical protein [Ralstonia pseudosolanacearum]MCK4165497.1 hypothetical protein [Ralstonia pseudosolanacearum]QKL79768.1 hypothetical protein HI805_25770 [Ralstonia solanacearum]
MIDKEIRIRLLLSAQNSLLGNVGRAVRCVCCDICEEGILLKFIFDGEVKDDDADAAEEAGTLMASHFDDADVKVQCVRVDAPSPFSREVAGYVVFQRKE